MSNVVVTVPMSQWAAWIAEGDLPGDPESDFESHFWIPRQPPDAAPQMIHPGERVYIVAHGKLRGYAPLVRIEERCQLNPSRSCLVRRGGAVAVTLTNQDDGLPFTIRGFQGVRYRWWDPAAEVPFPEWRTP